MIAPTDTGTSAPFSIGLLNPVRNHNLIAFRQAWRSAEEPRQDLDICNSFLSPAAAEEVGRLRASRD